MSNPSPLQQGITCYQHGKYGEAKEIFARIVAAEPEQTDALCLLGMAEKNLGEIKQAIARYQQAISLKPDFVVARFNLGNAFKIDGQRDEAIATYESLLELEPNYAGAHTNLGLLYQEQDRLDRAKQAYQTALEIDPNQIEALYNMGNLYKEQKDFDTAISYYQKAIALQPNFAEAWLNLGNSYYSQDNLSEAIAHYRRAAQINPNYTEAYYTSGNALVEQGCIAEAILDYYRALRVNSAEVRAHMGLAFALLAQGNLKQGFTEYEWRLQTPELSGRTFTQPAWDGSPLNGKTLLLHAEQGFGDSLQMLRYLPWVQEKGAKIIFECRQPLHRLFSLVPDIDTLLAPGEALPEHDCHSSLMSLPHLSGTTLATIPAPLSLELLSIPEPLLLPDTPSKTKVGIVWQGHPEHPQNHRRSCPLSEFSAIFDTPNTEFYSLQKEVGERDRDLLETHNIHPFPNPCQDFLDTAQTIRQLDLVVTIDTAVAHLAGTLGKPTWVLLHFSCDWRWMFVRLDSPWYPSIRLFRQSQPQDWSTVIAQVKQALVLSDANRKSL
ncbi:tetratricopeptide repeat protein [Roseofilum casamattae]|uniref:Tetratricopeptide repeat protein n=1 Tax=Roseofilum casamattae BLCC-M143 TaxID=3022442 RepID=A0ABT7BWI6_9CYAN|nr:tetratricopeptide repeat protein [Roseofilum casamattae]MDJ1182633.1 tetratricopeptide repeat protein [Roseofilum casamattae BLCC-M143]